ncbi:uncharacterized protein LOC135503443 [Lineus longissimus]|uniref:uncharacterized protein LOC135503443 n=1 Tax=Lineus longissimus TaxID=88925 RepID=UPI00315D6F4E
MQNFMTTLRASKQPEGSLVNKNTPQHQSQEVQQEYTVPQQQQIFATACTPGPQGYILPQQQEMSGTSGNTPGLQHILSASCTQSTPEEPENKKIGQDLWKQLKRVSIPTFTGDVRTYENWKAAFLACIDKAPATPEYKLLQLRGCLSGEALKTIENLGHSPSAYIAAKERLERKYGGRRRQVTLQFEELTSFPQIRPGNAKDLDKFADMLDIVVINLKDVGFQSELDSQLLYSVLFKKMTVTMVADYHRWVKERNEKESIEVLRRFVISESEYRTIATEAVKGLIQSRDGQTSSTKSDYKGSSRTHFTSPSVIQSHNPCPVCSKDHGIWKCDDFKAKDVAARWKIAKQQSLCYRCLSNQQLAPNVIEDDLVTSMDASKTIIGCCTKKKRLLNLHNHRK